MPARFYIKLPKGILFKRGEKKPLAALKERSESTVMAYFVVINLFQYEIET